MRYKKVKEGQFIKRPNRFIAYASVDGKEEICHVKNTGRLGELLYKGAKVYVEESDNKNRKTKFDLIAVYKGDILYNIDSQAPNKVMEDYIPRFFENVTYVKPECKYKNSRFDFYIEYNGKKAFMEVKGVTLEKNGAMLFPDAPTVRGVKHLDELCECVKEGYEAYAVFVICADSGEYFAPNGETHREFAEKLKRAKESGVNIIALKCTVTKDELQIKERMEVKI